MKILILTLLGLALTESAAVPKNVIEKNDKFENKINNGEIIDKTKREIKKQELLTKIDSDNLKFDGNNLESVEREKKECQFIKGATTPPTRICVQFNGPAATMYICDGNDNSPNSLNSPSSYYIDPSSSSSSPSYSYNPLSLYGTLPQSPNPIQYLTSPYSNLYSQKQQISYYPSIQETPGNYIIRPSYRFPGNYLPVDETSKNGWCPCPDNSISNLIGSYYRTGNSETEPLATRTESLNIETSSPVETENTALSGISSSARTVVLPSQNYRLLSTKPTIIGLSPSNIGTTTDFSRNSPTITIKPIEIATGTPQITSRQYIQPQQQQQQQQQQQNQYRLLNNFRTATIQAPATRVYRELDEINNDNESLIQNSSQLLTIKNQQKRSSSNQQKTMENKKK